MKKIMLGTSDAWSMSRSSHRPSNPANYIEDCRIFSGGGVSSHIYLRSIASNVTLKAFCLMPYSFWQKFCRSISSLLLSQTIRCLLDGVVMLLLPEKRTQCQTQLLPKNISFQQLCCYLNNNFLHSFGVSFNKVGWFYKTF